MPDNQYHHSCPTCKFKGQVLVGGKKWDVYTCNGSLLFRYGREGADYFCAPYSTYPQKELDVPWFDEEGNPVINPKSNKQVLTEIPVCAEPIVLQINEAYRQVRSKGWVWM